MFSAILRCNTRHLVNNAAKMCWHPALQPSLHPVLRTSVTRYSFSSRACKGPGPKSLIQPIWPFKRVLTVAYQRSPLRHSSSSGTCSGPGAQKGTQPVSLSERTINLAHQTSYTGAKKPASVKAVCPPGTKKPGERRYVPEPRPIKTCSSADLAKKCPKPPPVCPCPKPLTAMEIVGKAIMFLVKAAIVGGLVFWTIDIGVWGDADQSAALFNAIHARVREMLGMEPVDTEVQEVPNTDHMYHNALVTWNRGVVWSFEVITSVYDKISGMLGLDPKKTE